MLTDGSIFGVVEDRYCLSTRAQSAVGVVGGGVCKVVSNSEGGKLKRCCTKFLQIKGWNEIERKRKGKKSVQVSYKLLVTRNS